MTQWSGGYVSDIPYTHGFYRELCPSMIRFNALLAGFDPPPANDFNWCELGYGQGATACTLAAATPHGRFHGTDFNPDHLITINRQTQAAGLTNTAWFDDAFDEFTQRDLPPFDYVVMHGIYSWVNDATRAQIREFLRRHLKPNGFVYVSYNALPGWAAGQALRQLLYDHVRRQQAHHLPLTERFDKALAYALSLKDAGSHYFDASKEASGRLLGLANQDRTYLVHEYMNENWVPLYFRTVADQLAEAKLRYIGPASVHDHFDALSLQGKALQLYQACTDPIERQTLRDYLLNTPFRRDLFSRGRRALSLVERTQRLSDTRFALSTAPDRVSQTIDAPVGKVTLKQEYVAAIVETLCERPRTLGDLQQLTVLKGQGLPGVLQLVSALVGSGAITPCVEGEPDASAARRFNRSLAEQAVAGGEWNVFASPLTGAGLALTRIQQLLVLGRERAGPQPADWARFAADVLLGQGQRLTVDGKPLANPEENLAELTRQAKVFEANGLRLLRTHLAI